MAGFFGIVKSVGTYSATVFEAFSLRVAPTPYPVKIKRLQP